jgi:alkanesulfonate monooxygenase SsuD/methylene tetrahydromethanopterin reductase-like flavin-dependent oxidoreductase (luciferase family)
LWEVEHHCTPDFSYSSCPELILQAVAANTKRLRIGHAGILVPFEINHPLRAAERSALLDHLSGGRLEVGLAKSGGKEWETFIVSEQQAAADLVEATRMLPRVVTIRFRGAANGGMSTIATSSRSPQKPHPPIWHTFQSAVVRACRTDGCGCARHDAVCTAGSADGMIKTYRRAVAACKEPIRFINDSVAIFTFVHVAKTTMPQSIAARRVLHCGT